jgi:hypothetical protein
VADDCVDRLAPLALLLVEIRFARVALPFVDGLAPLALLFDDAR